MAFSVRRRRRKAAVSHSNRSSFPQKPKKIFKVILNPEAHMLKIPTEFTRRYRLRLPDHVFLRAPSGPAFEVELIDSNGDKWLHEGWNEFQEYYSLGFGSFLVFEYDGVSSFHVLIFDISASEMDYPFDEDSTESQSDDDSIPLMDKRGKGKILIEEDQTRGDVSDDDLCSSRKRKTRGTALDKETSMTYQRARAFRSDNPNGNSYFISLMQPSYVDFLFTLTIPASFVKENMPNKVNNIKLRVSDGKLWPVQCTLQGPNGRISRGWKRFVEDNGLKVGDVCVFEVSGCDKFVFNVTIFRN